MNLTCPHCSRTIPAENINIQTCIAKCGSCNAVFGFSDKVQGATAFNSSKRAVEMPKGYVMENGAEGLVITHKWFSSKYVFMLFFCIFWDGFLVNWYAIAFRHTGSLAMKVFPLLHVGVGVFLTYTTIAGFLNRTRITMNMGELRIKHFPLPWPGNRTIARLEIDQLFCEEKMSSSRNSTSYSYNLSAVMTGGRRVKLVSGLENPEDALFLEQQVENFLGITDRPVAGEMRPA